MDSKVFSSILLAGTVLAVPASAGTISVSNGGSIQAAINQAGAGDVVLVQPGTYAPFQVTKDNIKVVSAQPGGAHVVASSGRAISAYGQSNIEVSNFRISAPNSDGVAIGGSPGNLVRNIKFMGNTVETAGKDGFKFFQVDGLDMQDNTIKMAGALGRAGQGGNGNGDGGIDWVTVNNSRMVGNTVERTNGWACAMVKTGSHGNLIQDNEFRGCEVNGIDMAAGSSGRAGAANTTGKTAFNNRIEGNEISSGSGCAVKFHQTSTNNQVTGNTIRGRTCADPNGTNNSSANATVGGGSTDDDHQDYGSNDGADGYTDGVSATLVSMGGGKCSSAAMEAAMGAISGVAGVFTGGRATVVAQLAQQVQLMWANQCSSEQNDKLSTSNQNEAKMLEYLVLMLRSTNWKNENAASAAIQQIATLLFASGMIYDPTVIQEDYGRSYPEELPDAVNNEQVIAHGKTMMERQRAAQIEAQKMQAASAQSLQRTPARVAEIMAGSRAAVGTTAATQENTKMLGLLVERLSSQDAAELAKQRADTNEMAREQTEKAMEERAYRNSMQGWGECSTCKGAKISWE